MRSAVPQPTSFKLPVTVAAPRKILDCKILNYSATGRYLVQKSELSDERLTGFDSICTRKTILFLKKYVVHIQ